MQGRDTLTPDHIAPGARCLGAELCADRTGHVLAISCARMYIYRVVESAGKFKEADGGVWTAQEIADNWGAITKV